MNTKLLTIFTRTPLHVGAGSSVGAVDQPVVRERHTRFPAIPGTAIKGVLADLWLDRNDKDNPVRNADGVKLFGKTDAKDAKAGQLMIGEGRLLAFPVRSAKKCFAWITCPLALERFARDTGVELPVLSVGDEKALAPVELTVEGHVIFEEYPLPAEGTVPDAVITALSDLSDEPVWKDSLKAHLAVVSDELFAYFAENACEIANHNRIEDTTGVVAKGALFSQENVPSETMFYSVVNAVGADGLDQLGAKLAEEKGLLQIGADMTTGLGWCGVALKEVK